METNKGLVQASKVIKMQSQMIAEARIGMQKLIRMTDERAIGNIEVNKSLSEILKKMNDIRELHEKSSSN